MEKKLKFKNVALILASGSGKRMGHKTPKQFLKLGKKTILQLTLEAFRQSGLIDKIFITLPPGSLLFYRREIARYKQGDFVELVEGGAIRQESSCNGVMHVEALGGAEIILIHDAARPFLTAAMIQDSITMAKKYGAAEIGVPSVDTLVETDGRFIKKILNRDHVYKVQTPQTFKFHLIRKAHLKAIEEGLKGATDDAQLILRLGKRVAVVQGSHENLKITSPVDFELAKLLVASRKS